MIGQLNVPNGERGCMDKQYQVIIKSPASFYKKLFRGRYQVVTPAFKSRREAEEFVRKNKKFDAEFRAAGLDVPYKYRVKVLRSEA